MSSRQPGVASPGAHRASPGRWVLAVGVLASAALLAGCAGAPSASSTSSTSTTQRSHHSSSTTTAGASATTTTEPATSTGTSPASTLCQPSQLALAVVGGTGAAGTLTTTVGMTNTSSAGCTMEGYPGMQLLSAQGTPLPTTVVRGQAHFPTPAANGAPALVSLAAGASARFSILYSDVPVGGETTCPTSKRSEVTPPTDTAFAVMTLSVTACGNGTLHVSPVYP